MADPAQLDDFVSELLAEGLLDEQFSQLMQLQDDTNPHFVAEVDPLGPAHAHASVKSQIGHVALTTPQSCPGPPAWVHPWQLCTSLSLGSCVIPVIGTMSHLAAASAAQAHPRAAPHASSRSE